MCYPALEFVSDKGVKPVTNFITDDLDKDTRNWVISGIQELEQRKGYINNGDLETKHIKDKVFELKFKKLPVRVLYSYHPTKRKFLLLLHGVIKKRDELKSKDIKVALDRYKIEWSRKYK